MATKPGYRCIIPLSMCYLGFSLTASSLVHKFIQIGAHTASAGSFIMPFWFMTAGIVAEVYGYKLARWMLWSLMFVELIFYSCLQFFAVFQADKVPSGTPYYFVFGAMTRTYFSVWASIFFANFINTFIISKLKILLNCRYLWMRSVFASAVGEILYTAVGFYGILGGTISNAELLWLIYWGCLLKVVITALVATPSVVIANIIKKIEGVDTYDINVNYNPFKLEL